MNKTLERAIDLHIHTNFSDGTFTPEEVVDRASKLGLKAVAITDHDEVGGLERALFRGEQIDFEVVPGVELSTNGDGRDVHILGYFLDFRAEAIKIYIENFQKERKTRAKKIVKRLQKLGLKIPFEFVLQKAGEGSIGRPHIASVMLENGDVFSIEEAFHKYLGDGKPAFVPKLKIDPVTAIRMIHDAGGMAFIAHPAVDVTTEYVVNLIGHGLDGIETVHPHHSKRAMETYRQLAIDYGVLECGGSDCHGNTDGRVRMGSFTAPLEFLEKMKERLPN